MNRQSVPPADDPRDAHLLAALRHAPDHAVAPPPHVTAAIIAQAQAAVRASSVQPARERDGWRAIWERLWQPAPMAAFGTLAMATLIGVLWGGGQGVPEATPSLRPGPGAVATVAEPKAAPAAVAPAADRDATVAVEPDARMAKAPAGTPAEALRSQRSSKESAPRVLAEGGAAGLTAGKRTAASADAPLPAQRMAQGGPPAARTATVVAPAPAATPVAQAAAVPMPATSPAAAVEPASALARMAAAPAPEARQDAMAKSLADAAPARARSEQASLGAAGSVTGSALAQPTAEIDAALSREPLRIRWRLAAGKSVRHEAAQREWWSTLGRATQGRWRLAAADSQRGTESPAITLLLDDVVRGSLGFEPQAVIWRDAKGTTWRASIPAETVRDWQEALARW